MTNLVTNPGAETGNLAGWAGSGVIVSSTSSHSGSRAFLATNLHSSLSQNISLSIGTTYLVSLWTTMN